MVYYRRYKYTYIMRRLHTQFMKNEISFNLADYIGTIYTANINLPIL